MTKTAPPGTFELKDDLLRKQQSQDSSTSKPAEVKTTKPTGPPATAAPSRPPPVSPERGQQPQSPPTSPAPTNRTQQPQPQQAPNPFTITHKRTKSTQASKLASSNSSTLRIHPPSTTGAFFQKVVIISSGTSPIGSALVRLFHSAGARVIFGHNSASSPESTAAGSPLTAAGVASNLIKSLGPPHTAHYNTCDIRRYGDLLALFKLARTMYGRVDHAIFLADDGGSKLIAEREKGWLQRHVTIEDVEGGEPPGSDLAGTLAAATRFAHIALPYLRKPSTRRRTTLDSTSSDTRPREKEDRSLTFVSSVAGFVPLPGLPIHQVNQHGVLGLVRSLRSLVMDAAAPVKVRVNAVCPSMMIPRTMAAVGGRMSVKMPRDEPEDVARVAVGVVAASGLAGEESGRSSYETAAGDDDDEKMMKSATGGGPRGPWNDAESALHGRVLYMVGGGQCWDVDEGLALSEQMWLGQKGSESMRMAQDGIGKESQWVLDVF